jgi:hypothetical protein
LFFFTLLLLIANKWKHVSKQFFIFLLSNQYITLSYFPYVVKILFISCYLMFLSLHFLVLYFILGIPSLHMFTRGVPVTPVNRIILSLNHIVFCTLTVKKTPYYINSKRLSSSRTMVVDIISWNQY